ncbi:MAG TPA: UvrD-helicase domain-containing protein [Herpetosiphonaceae bacterium]
MSVRWQQIRAFATAAYDRYAAALGHDVPFPLAVDDLVERVYLLTAFVDPTLDRRINGELNPVIGSIRLRPGLAPERARFIMAHELGHYVVEGAATLFEDDDTTLDERAGGENEIEGGVLRVYNTRERQEQDANLFALELLVPAAVLWQMVQQPGWTITDLAETFGVSTDALRTQLLNVCCYEPLRSTPAEQDASTHTFAPDPEQQAAVDAPLPTLVVAGPGTGKTRSIVAKYVALVEAGVDPASILSLTFSNKAAEEMRTRIVRALSATRPDLAGRAEVQTFHAWGLNFLKAYGPHVGLPLTLHLRAPGDLFVLLKRRLAELPLEQYKLLHDPGYYLGAIMGAISRAKDELRTPAEYRVLVDAEAERIVAAALQETAGKTTKAADEARDKARRSAARLRELAAIYAQYESLLREEGVVDYGDVIMQSVAALRIPAVASEVRAKYQYILVDEFQDINYAAGQVIALLDGGRGRVWAVGDPWQSIYRFRGASAANLAEFEAIYPATTTVRLVRNYRSVQAILDAAHHVMQHDPQAAQRTGLRAQRPASRRQQRVVEWAAESSAAEYAAIAHDILRRVGGKRLRGTRCAHRRPHRPRRVRSHAGLYRTHRPRFGDHTILCRTNPQVRRVVAALEAHGIPTEGGGELLDYPEVKDALAICALARSINSVGMLRALTLPEHRLSADDLECLVRNAYAERRSLQRATRDATIVDDVSEEGQRALQRLYDLHDDLAVESDAWRVLTRYLFDSSTTMRERMTRAACGDTQAQRQLANLGQLALVARNFVRQAPADARDAQSFIAYVRLLIEAGEDPPAAPLAHGADAVRVMTVHSAKGLEFRTVYVPHVHHDGFPPRKRGSVIPSIAGLVHGPVADADQEERYLLYVAMTRAQDRLVLSRTQWKHGKPIARSTLLPHETPWPIRRISAERRCHAPLPDMRLRHAAVQPTTIAASSIETYERCPRRYLYQYGYQLFDDQTPFLRMHQTIKHTIRALRELAEAGSLPEDEQEVERLVQQMFTRNQLDAVTYRDEYFAEAMPHVRRIWQDLRANPSIAGDIDREIVVQRPAGRIAVRVDRIERTPDGTRYVQVKSGKRGDKDHLSTRVMVYALAAEAAHDDGGIMIQYTATGDMHPVKPRADVLKRHSARIDELLEGIAAGRWEPNYGEHCDTCPFNVICPV